MDKLRVAVVGAGYISSGRHLPAYHKLGDRVELVGISDLDQDLANAAAGQAQVDAVYADAAQMIDDLDPDLVDICTPPATHAALADTAVAAKCNLLIEKPMALTVDDCDRIIETASTAGTHVCVAHTGLFYEPFLKARELVASGELGAFVAMKVKISTPTDYMTSKSDHWAHKLPGGVIGETGPHPVYMSLAFLEKVDSVSVDGVKLLPQFPWSQYEDYQITLFSERGMSSININYATSQWLVEVEIACTNGTIIADLHGRRVVVRRRPKLTPARIGRSVISEAAQTFRQAGRTAAALAARRSSTTHDRLISAYVSSLLTSGESPVPPAQGREAVKVMSLIAQELDRQRASDVSEKR